MMAAAAAEGSSRESTHLERKGGVGDSRESTLLALLLLLHRHRVVDSVVEGNFRE